MQELAAALDIPPLAPIPHDHVLTRAFYLLDDFPGRYAGNPVWAEAPPPDAEQAAGMPFRNLNDGVTPVVIVIVLFQDRVVSGLTSGGLKG